MLHCNDFGLRGGSRGGGSDGASSIVLIAQHGLLPAQQTDKQFSFCDGGSIERYPAASGIWGESPRSWYGFCGKGLLPVTPRIPC